MAESAAHIVWDWNGTLFQDMDAVITATNAAFGEVGMPAITLETYRENYCVPVPLFYERLMGRAPTAEEWSAMDAAFHQHYTRAHLACGLAEGAAALLAGWRAPGRSQSILSLAGHAEVVALVRGFGIEPHFIRVEGRRGPSGGSKAEQMVAHLAALAEAGVDPGRTVVIGDAADDAVAARHVGAHAVLYTGGSHRRESLLGAGDAVVDTLTDAVAEATRLVGTPTMTHPTGPPTA
ncbi:HAD family hydrolase [Streptomyces sp. NPDC050560]|uniref:HAD family hydrolase n=1 Tax=Streptomyces sp. NPDC050560 TaxID=3365630 RepID=UPI00379EA64E